MGRLAEPRLERPDLSALARRHPWLAASLAVHAALAAALYTAGPVRVQLKRDDGVRAQVNDSLRQTAHREMQRQLRTMEEIRRALEQSAGAASAEPARGAAKAAQDPAARARELAEAIEAVQRKIRATEMARALGIPEQAALKRVEAEAARLPKPALPKGQPPEAVVARLAAQARAALAQRRSQLLAQQQGVRLNQPGQGAAGDGRSGGGGRGAGPGSTGMSSASLGSQVEALAKGLEMGTPTALTGSSLDMSSSSFSDIRGYGSFLAPPAVDASRVRAGSGRVLGAGGPYANRIHLDAWYVIGPFEGQGGASQKAVYPPERGLDLDAVYYGKNDMPVRWTWQQDAGYPSIPLPRAENAVYYAYTEVMMEEDADLWVSIGADDDSKMWFNDRLVWISGDGDKPWYRQPFYQLHDLLAARNLTEGQRKLHFHKGRNTILFKLYNGVNLMFFSVVLSPAP